MSALARSLGCLWHSFSPRRIFPLVQMSLWITWRLSLVSTVWQLVRWRTVESHKRFNLIIKNMTFAGWFFRGMCLELKPSACSVAMISWEGSESIHIASPKMWNLISRVSWWPFHIMGCYLDPTRRSDVQWGWTLLFLTSSTLHLRLGSFNIFTKFASWILKKVLASSRHQSAHHLSLWTLPIRTNNHFCFKQKRVWPS